VALLPTAPHRREGDVGKEMAASSTVAAPGRLAVKSPLFQEGENKRGIPEAIFVSDVQGMVGDRPATELVNQIQELYGKYQYMQSSLTAQRAGLKSKLPDIATALETVRHLIERRDKSEAEPQDTEYTYQLSENLWTKASVPPSNKVCLWLGASVMLEYTLDEAVALLEKNEGNARESLKSIEDDVAFLRDQLTTTEVNIARVHNYGVKMRQQEREKAEAAGAGGSQPQAALSSSAAAASGSGKNFTWKQDGSEVEVSVELPSKATKDAVDVKILADSLRVTHAGEVILEGSLAGACRPGGSTWTFSNGRAEVSLEKADPKPWPSLFD